MCSANERHLKVLAKQSWESWGTGSLSPAATEIRANKEKTPTEVSIPWPKRLPHIYGWGCWVVNPLATVQEGLFCLVYWLVYCSVSLASEGGTLSTRGNIDFIDPNPGVSAATAGAQDFIGRFIGRFILVSERASGGTSWGGDPGQEKVGISFPQVSQGDLHPLAGFGILDRRLPAQHQLSATVCWNREDSITSGH